MRFLLALLVGLAGAAGLSAPVPRARALKLPFTFKGHTGPVFGVALSPDGKRIASGSDDGTVRVWDAATGKNLLTLNGHTDHPQWTHGLHRERGGQP
jgi:WD40 repeat protein